MTTATPTESAPVRYYVTGMDCTDCVAKIEKAARAVPGVDDVRVSLTSQVLTLRTDDGTAPVPRPQPAPPSYDPRSLPEVSCAAL